MNWSRENIAWASGFIEGEGCITRQITTKRSTQYSYWLLKVSSTDLDALEKLQQILTVGRIYKQTRSAAHHKKTWQLTVYRQPELYAVLAAIFDFLCLRRRLRAEEALREMSARGPWREGRRFGRIGKAYEGARR